MKLLWLLLVLLAGCVPTSTDQASPPPLTSRSSATVAPLPTPSQTPLLVVRPSAPSSPPPAAPLTTATLPPTLTAPPVSPTASLVPATPTITPSLPTTLPSPLPSPSATPIVPTSTPTPDPFAPYYIETLATRQYGEGAIQVGELLAETDAFRRYALVYPSDGLRVTGYLTLPRGQGPFPVVLLNHGYYTPERYRQGDGTRAAADWLASRGFLAIASDYRNYAGSDAGPNNFRSGYVIDVMNLLASLRTLPAGWADPERVGVWGHSMGGGITINVAVLAGEQVDGVVVYGGMSGDMADNARHILAMWQRDEFGGPVAEWGGAG